MNLLRELNSDDSIHTITQPSRFPRRSFEGNAPGRPGRIALVDPARSSGGLVGAAMPH